MIKMKKIIVTLFLSFCTTVLFSEGVEAREEHLKAGSRFSDLIDTLYSDVNQVSNFTNRNKGFIQLSQTGALQTDILYLFVPIDEEELVEEEVSSEVPTQEVTTTTVTQLASQVPTTSTEPVTGDTEQAAKEEIARRESGGSYTARNGQYYGRYQLTITYLNGDLSPENQERVADAYVKGRYGSWTAALAFWNANGWY